MPPRPKPFPPPCGCAESTSRFRAPTWVRFSLRRWGMQPPSASCHPTPPFGRGWVTLRFRVFGGRHRFPASLRGVSGNHPLRFWSPETLLRSAGREACYFAEDAGGSIPLLPPRKPEPTPSRSNCSALSAQPQPPTALGGFPPTHSGCFIYIPSFCEATGRKNRVMLATIEQRGC